MKDKIEEKIFISMSKNDLEMIIIDCVNACLKNSDITKNLNSVIENQKKIQQRLKDHT